MAEQNFSWLPDESAFELKKTEVSNVREESSPKLTLKAFLLRILEHKRGLIAIFFLLGLLLVIKLTQKAESSLGSTRLEVMTASLPIPKGKTIEGMLLMPSLMNPYSFSKTQKLQLLTAEGAEKLMGKVRAKKDIAPQAPLFWSDLELIPEPVSKVQRPLPKIIYPEDSP